MKMRTGWIPLLLAAALGLASLLAVRSGWANYIWDRWNYGGSVSVSSRCFDLPSGWTVVPGSREGVSDVRRHFVGGGPDVLVSVLPVAMVAGLKRMGAGSTSIDSGFAVYDLGLASPGGSLRYIALSETEAIALMAARDELLRELAVGLSTCK
jgi:hypothetical protein